MGQDMYDLAGRSNMPPAPPQPPLHTNVSFPVELSMLEAGYLVGLIERADMAYQPFPTLARRIMKAAAQADRKAIEAANARYLGRRSHE